MSVGRAGGRLQILRRELLPQFLIDPHETWHRNVPWGVDVKDSFFNSGRKCVAMVMVYYGKKGENFASLITSSVFDKISWN